MNNCFVDLKNLETVPARVFLSPRLDTRDLFASQLGTRADSIPRAIRIISECSNSITIEELAELTKRLYPNYIGRYDDPTILCVLRNTNSGVRKSHIVLSGHHRIAAARLFGKEIETTYYDTDFNIGYRYGNLQNYQQQIDEAGHPVANILQEIPYLVNFSVITRPFREV